MSTQVIQRDRHAAYFTALAVTAGTIERLCVELRHLQRTEVREVEEGFGKGQKGSSAMPHTTYIPQVKNPSAAALRPQAASTRSPAGQSSSNSSPGHRFRPRRQAPRPYLRR